MELKPLVAIKLRLGSESRAWMCTFLNYAIVVWTKAGDPRWSKEREPHGVAGRSLTYVANEGLHRALKPVTLFPRVPADRKRALGNVRHRGKKGVGSGMQDALSGFFRLESFSVAQDDTFLGRLAQSLKGTV